MEYSGHRRAPNQGKGRGGEDISDEIRKPEGARFYQNCISSPPRPCQLLIQRRSKFVTNICEYDVTAGITRSELMFPILKKSLGFPPSRPKIVNQTPKVTQDRTKLLQHRRDGISEPTKKQNLQHRKCVQKHRIQCNKYMRQLRPPVAKSTKIIQKYCNSRVFPYGLVFFGVVAGMSWWKVRFGRSKPPKQTPKQTPQFKVCQDYFEMVCWVLRLKSLETLAAHVPHAGSQTSELRTNDSKVMIMCPYDIYRSLYSASGWRSSCRPIPPCMGNMCGSCSASHTRIIPEPFPMHTFHSCVAVAMHSLGVWHDKPWQRTPDGPFSLQKWLLDFDDVWQTLESAAGVQA